MDRSFILSVWPYLANSYLPKPPRSFRQRRPSIVLLVTLHKNIPTLDMGNVAFTRQSEASGGM